MDTVPKSFLCPISHQIMGNPVIDKEGHSFDNDSIISWLNNNNTSPITRNPLYEGDLKPNYALRDAINEFMKDVKSEKLDNNIDTNTDIELNLFSNEKYKLISIIPPEGNDRNPIDICVVIDISGSMSADASIKNEKGENESYGLTLLDIAKHALKTIVTCLNENDKLGIVVYSTTARILVNMKYMTEIEKQNTLQIINKIHTEGSTNIWDGLQLGMNQLKSIQESEVNKRNSSLFLLTDGLPNVEPPRGHINMLNKYFDENPQFYCTINTFGFGYSLDSKLLNDIAKIGKGIYSFIPDSSFVGTVFEHALANTLSTLSLDNFLYIEADDLYSIMNISYIYPVEYTSWGAKINIGNLQYGQSKDILIELNSIDTNINVTFSCYNLQTNKLNRINNKKFQNYETLVNIHKKRTKFSEIIEIAINHVEINDIKNATVTIKLFIDQLKKSDVKDNEYIQDFIKDIEGQVTEAFSRSDWYNKWGKHYIPSLLNAHLLQQCNNFKDFGVQHFGGKLFKKLLDHADDVFCKLPPPEPQRYNVSSQRIQSMQTFSQSSNVCIDGNCSVLMNDNTTKLVKNIKKNDCVKTPNGFSKVLCVIKSPTNGYEHLIEFNDGLKITAWHPIRMNNDWYFPIELIDSVKTECDAVYSFLLENDHIMFINNIEVVCLAHNFDFPKVKHEYFGTEKIINDLKKFKEFEDGFITLPQHAIKRNRKGIVIGLKV